MKLLSFVLPCLFLIGCGIAADKHGRTPVKLCRAFLDAVGSNDFRQAETYFTPDEVRNVCLVAPEERKPEWAGYVSEPMGGSLRED